MKGYIVDRIMIALVISTFGLAGIGLAAQGGQRDQQDEQKSDREEKQQRRKEDQQQDQNQRKAEQGEKQEQHRAQQQEKQQEQKLKQDQRQRDNAQRISEQDKKDQSARQQQQRDRVDRQAEQVQQQKRQNQIEQQRLSQQQQQQRINEQRQQVVQYRQHLEQQERLAAEQSARLQQQKRMAQYRFQEEYLERLRQQQVYLRDHRFDYDYDPYFYTAAIYRYNRGGKYYQINEYGAKALRQSVSYGYEEGFRAGKADRDDRWRGGNFRDSYAYRDANYGYSGYYVNRTDYNHYFREGFRRGYEDGYNSRYQYGRFDNGSYSILDAILSQILNFQNLR